MRYAINVTNRYNDIDVLYLARASYRFKPNSFADASGTTLINQSELSFYVMKKKFNLFSEKILKYSYLFLNIWTITEAMQIKLLKQILLKGSHIYSKKLH